ncbi:MAG: hypothetical protein ABJF01_05435 [bacterium]
MSTSVYTTTVRHIDDQTGMEQRGKPLRTASPSIEPRPCTADPSWAPAHATVGIVDDASDARRVCQLRYRVYVHEQGKQPDGADWERGELTDSLDSFSRLWYARDGETIVGTVAQTIIGADFDLSRLPAALELDRFPRSNACPLGFSSRFAIAPDHRSTWVLPSLARYTYAYGRELGAKFDFMATNPGLVPLFERLGYVRYTASAVCTKDVGLLIPMVLPATDYEHLRKTRSACLPATTYFPDEPEWAEWLRATHPIIGTYYESDPGHHRCGAALAARLHLPIDVATELSSMSFVHCFPAGALLRREGDRATCTFMAIHGRLNVDLPHSDTSPAAACAPDGVAFSRVTIGCETDAAVLCVPDTAVARIKRRYPEHAACLQQLPVHTAAPDGQAGRMLR